MCSEDCRKAIIEESRHWVNKNKGLLIQSNSYTSPRISSEIPDCSMPMTFDNLSYCSLGCLYCFAYFFKSNNPTLKKIELKSVNVPNMIAALEGNPKDARGRSMWKHFYHKKFLLHWGGLADPFCYFERANWHAFPLIKALGRLNYPTLFSFKGDAVLHRKYMKLFGKYATQRNFAFQVSIITGNQTLARDMEIGVPTPLKRIEALHRLSEMGYWTILRLRPYIIGVSDQGIDELLHRALEAGIKGVSMEFFALDARANKGMKTRYDWIAKLMGVDDLMEYFSTLSPSERGGYMRLNRLVKEPHIRRVYEFCVKNNLVFGCSDPDFKELNTSGSCCAMPDYHPENKGLENWTRSQLTYHLKEARLKYHQTGERIELTFGQVYADESYLDDKKFTSDHIAVTGMCNAERQTHTYRSILRDKWNNLRSPSNPRNYFHGKLMPVRADENGDLVYAYTPSDFEDRWTAEGVDLSK